MTTAATEPLDAAEPLREAGRRGGARAWLNAVDLSVYRAFRSLAREERRVAAVRRFSGLGEHGMLWLGFGIGGSLVDRRRAARWRSATATVGIAYVSSSTIKVAIGRQRPAVENLPALMATPTGLSFPSSHSSSSFAAAQAYSGLLPAGVLYVVAVPMALSRLFLGVHYPSDILAGAALGSLIGRVGRG
ncbi:MAG: phosphatase PAP2 family protein [Solirubrobacteraceae bacterium]